jgi:feruloyl esterase
MALMEAQRYPEDFDGIIAGDPFMSIRSLASGAQFNKQQLKPQNFIPFLLLGLIDKATTAACDAADGVTDGLIQNPAACSFNAASLLCKPGQTQCLSQGQVDTLNAYFTGARDDDGNVVYPGQSISDLGGTDGAALWTTGFFLPGQPLVGPNNQPLSTQATFDLNAPEPWGNDGFSPSPLGWQFIDHGLKYIVERNPGFNLRDFTAKPTGPIDEAALRLFDARTEAGDADDPRDFAAFINQNRKLLIYHGLSDPALTAMRTIMFYEDLADRAEGGFKEVQENVRLFLVPGMHHCSGGPGPNVFETLTPLENWVEKGEAPDGILAAKFVNDNPAQGVARTMPLCKFPEEARFHGNPGDPASVNNGANWECTSADARMLDVGANGRQAGLGLRQAEEHGGGPGPD